MRFKASIRNISTFTKFTASLATLGHIAWVKLDEEFARFTVIPEQGTQVWSILTIDTIFEKHEYTIQSAAEGNAINLEVPLAPLQRALKSAQHGHASFASIRLTKKDNIPLLSLTITTQAMTGSAPPAASNGHPDSGEQPQNGFGTGDSFSQQGEEFFGRFTEREVTITQDVPVRVLAPASVAGLHEPRCREPDVHITLPNLMQLKGISDRFTKLAMSTKNTTRTAFNSAASGPKLELSANAHGCLKLALNTDAMRISSMWTGLENPELDPSQAGEEGLANHPSTRMKALGDASGQSDEGWATVRVEGRDWGRVLSVGRLGGKVIACFCHDHALILYVYLTDPDTGGESEASVLTYFVPSYMT